MFYTLILVIIQKQCFYVITIFYNYYILYIFDDIIHVLYNKYFSKEQFCLML